MENPRLDPSRRQPNAEPQTTGFAEVTTDDEGRFSLAPIAVGGLQLDLKPPVDLPVAVDLPQGLSIREGREDSVDIPLKRTVTITGLFLERGTGKPVPGITVMLIDIGGNRNGSLSVKTDERGRYTFQSLPGLVRVGHFTFPPTHVMAPSQGWEDFTVPEPPKVIELATREALLAAPPLRGKVVDEAGQAVPGATVQASWMLAGGDGSSSGTVLAKSDEEGQFTLEGLGPGSTVTITARLRGQQNQAPVSVQAGDPGPVTVAIAVTPVLAVGGRLLGPSGAPLAGIPIRVQFRVPRDNFQGFPEQARFEDNPEIKTGPDGTFKTPKELERKPSEFRVEVVAEGFLPGRTPWVPSPASDLLTLPDLVLKRSRGIRVVTGRVVDRDGRPIPGASASQGGDGPRWTSTKADAEGRFRLTGVAGGEAIVLAEAPGFRDGGAIVRDGVEPIEIRLARESEPPVEALKSLPSLLSRPQERALAREILEPVLPVARSGSLGIVNASVIPALARVDPDRVLDMIEARVIGPTGNTAVGDPFGPLIEAALAQFEDDPARAMATIGDDLDPASRAAGWLALEEFGPRTDRARRGELLGLALADVHRSGDSEAKVRLLGRIADRWLELGSVERARPLLLEGKGIIDARPKDRWSFELEEFAESLAAIDLPAALALFERRGWTNVSPTDAATLNRHKGQAAIRLAAIDPAEAERLIGPPTPDFYERPGVVLRVARKMATLDLDRARRILETIDDESGPGTSPNPALVPFGLGAIADALSGTDPARARGLLVEAFGGLRKIAVEGSPGQGQPSIANLMAELLPVVERIEPDRLAERIWLLAASRAPSVQEPGAQEIEGTFALAMLVTRYNRAVADAIAAPALERLPDFLVDSNGSYSNNLATIFKSLAAYDPRAIVPLLRSLPETTRVPPPERDTWTAASIEAQFRLAAAQILGFPPEARPREAGRIGNFLLPYRLDD
ncbi:carboxypeptidase regulatory-like domain-containing protein [Tundrisphaera lichenicola]|uniref:carboxypeptidase regulatory-like domain-containing protein n=1 Tax=Tundrisphaera lichenicola TaxID=2029860 RepID=UPI003EB750AC